MSNVKKVIVVTGANKGIGRAIVEGLLDNSTNATIYLAARDVARGTTAVEELASKAKSTSNTLKYGQLDVTDETSVQNFATTLKAAENRIDVLVNNAGIYIPTASYENAQTTFEVNYDGIKRVTDALIGLLKPGSRVINLASGAGIMTGKYAESKIQQLSTTTTIEQVDEFVKEYLEYVKSGKSVEGVYPPNAYHVSKSAVIAYSVILSKRLAEKQINVNAICPGYVATDLNGHSGPLTVQQGADTAVYLATVAEIPFNGTFVSERKEKSWF